MSVNPTFGRMATFRKPSIQKLDKLDKAEVIREESSEGTSDEEEDPMARLCL